VREHVDAHHEVVRASQPEVVEVRDTTEREVAARAVALDRVLARIDAAVGRRRTHAAQHRLPAPLSATHVEHRAHGSLEEVLGGRDRVADLAFEPRPRAEALTAVPALEVLAVVLLDHTPDRTLVAVRRAHGESKR